MTTPAPLRGQAEKAPESLVGRLLEGRYRVEQKLGEGGLGTVYRAQHLKLARPVAVKVLREDLRAIPQIRARFEREVKALSSMAHPNIVTITDYGLADGSPYLVMELVEGKELAKMIGAPIEPARALAIVRQILSSLAYAHERDVVHRDLKPANVIVRQLPDGRDHAVVLDFGLAKFVGDDAGAELTRSGLVVGTPAYMPPEQMAAGARRADARSDLYSAGLILFELVSGRRPFQFDEPADLLRAHLVMEPPKVSEALGGTRVDLQLEALIAKALAKAPDDRFASARKMIDAIDALPPGVLVGDRPLTAAPPPPPPPRIEPTSIEPMPRRGGGWWKWRLGLAAIFVSAVAGLSWNAGRESVLVHEPIAASAITHEAPTAPPVLARAEPPRPEEHPREHSRAQPITVIEVAAVPDVPPPPLEAEAPIDIEPEALAAPAEIEAPEAPVEPVLDEAPIVAEVETPRGPEAEGIDPETTPFVPPPVQVGPRPPARNPLRGRLPSLLARVYQRARLGREVSQGDLRALARYRNEHALDPRVRLVLGHAYVSRGWYTQALEQYDRAIALDAGARGDPELIERLLRMVRSEVVSARAIDAVVRIFGAEARGPLMRALERETDPARRARLSTLRQRLGST